MTKAASSHEMQLTMNQYNGFDKITKLRVESRVRPMTTELLAENMERSDVVWNSKYNLMDLLSNN